MTFFTQRGYPLTSLEQDLRRVTTMGRPDALTRSERGDTTVDRVPLVISTSELSHFIHRAANVRHLSTATHICIVAYKCDLGLRDILVHSTNSSSTEQPGSHACQRPWCQTCKFITPLTNIRGLKSTFTIRDHFTYMLENLVYCIHPAADALISTSVKLGKVSGVEFVSICEAHATLHPWISCGTTFQLRWSQYYRCPGARYAFVSRFHHSPQTTGNEANSDTSQ